MNDVMFTVLEIVVCASILVVMRYVVPYLKLKLSSKIDADVWEQIVREVKSVEQTIIGEKLGSVKKEEVLVRVTAWITAHGISITQKQLSDLIEAAVWVMKNEGK